LGRNAVDLGNEALASYISGEAKASLPRIPSLGMDSCFVLTQQHLENDAQQNLNQRLNCTGSELIRIIRFKVFFPSFFQAIHELPLNYTEKE